MGKIRPNSCQQEPVPIIDLEQLCRSLTVNDLKDELIRKKIYELKLLIDERHKNEKNYPLLVKLRKDNVPVLIAMPPITQQRRRTTIIQPTRLFQSKSINLQAPYHANYHDTIQNHNHKYSSHSSASNHLYTRRPISPTKYKLP